MTRLVDADVVTARLQKLADASAGIMHGSPRGARNRDIATGRTTALEDAIWVVRDAIEEGAPVEASTGEAESATSGSISDGGSIGAVDVEGAPATFSPIHPDRSHGVEPHASGVGVAVSESVSREAPVGVLPSPGCCSDTAESPAAAPPPGALEGVGAPASPDPASDFLELQEQVSGALLKAHRLAVWRDEALPLLDQWLDLAHAARDAGLIRVPYGQSTTAALARWIRQHIEQHKGGQQ